MLSVELLAWHHNETDEWFYLCWMASSSMTANHCRRGVEICMSPTFCVVEAFLEFDGCKCFLCVLRAREDSDCSEDGAMKIPRALDDARRGSLTTSFSG